MPIYEYYCEKDDRVFETLGSFAASDRPAKCPVCGGEAVRIMPTTFATLSRVKGLKERVPFHHHPVRNETEKRTIAPVKPKAASSGGSGRRPPVGARTANSAARTASARKAVKKKG